MFSFSLLSLALSGVLCFQGYQGITIWLALFSVLSSISFWFRDVTAEGSYLGEHTKAVQRGLTLGFILFVTTEVMFFVSLFWAYLHSGLSPSIEVGTQWPPVGLSAIDPFGLPLLNTFLLLSSGAAVTYSHHALLNGDRSGSLYGMLATILFSVVFTGCQLIEYSFSNFNISDSVYGSSFFLATGMHGFHVIMGTIFLMVGGWRIYAYNVSREHHVGLEASILYWHFVDLVWLILFSLMYVWASL